ncbi:MAG: urea transporter [Bdellovibrionaceae bacterium]|nr:urea transporter [Pseudobdellovibrionaceae bacterium]
MMKETRDIIFLKPILNGFGQVMLQKNQMTGIFFLAGVFWSNWYCGLAGTLAGLAGCVLARIRRFPQQEIDDGLYAFSPILVGTALATQFDHSLLVWISAILGGVGAASLQRYFIAKKIPVFTLPFILMTWALIVVARQFPSAFPGQLGSMTALNSFSGLQAGTNGFGEVFFQSSALSGVLFFVGVFVNRPISALYALAASFLGAVFAQVFGQPIEMIHLGLFGFNAVLTAIVFSGNEKSDGAWVLIGVAVTVALDIFLSSKGTLSFVGGAFTLPFVLGTWLTLGLQKIVARSSWSAFFP